METTNVIERIMETPFNDAIQSIWVIGAVLLVACYGIGVFQCRRIVKAMKSQHNYHRINGELLLGEKWLAFCLFLISPVWAPIGLVGEGIGRGANAIASTVVDRFLTKA